jgi:hypothetical protein
VGKQDLTEVLNLKTYSFRLSLPDICIAALMFKVNKEQSSYSFIVSVGNASGA